MKLQINTRFLTSIVAVLLFGLYLSADLINSLHNSILHQKISEEICSIEPEEDACHSTIYHQDAQNGCDHTEHFVPKIVDCELCSIILQRHTLPKAEVVLLHHFDGVCAVSRLVFVVPAKEYHYSYLLRGPPTFS